MYASSATQQAPMAINHLDFRAAMQSPEFQALFQQTPEAQDRLNQAVQEAITNPEFMQQVGVIFSQVIDQARQDPNMMNQFAQMSIATSSQFLQNPAFRTRVQEAYQKVQEEAEVNPKLKNQFSQINAGHFPVDPSLLAQIPPELLNIQANSLGEFLDSPEMQGKTQQGCLARIWSAVKGCFAAIGKFFQTIFCCGSGKKEGQGEENKEQERPHTFDARNQFGLDSRSRFESVESDSE